MIDIQYRWIYSERYGEWHTISLTNNYKYICEIMQNIEQYEGNKYATHWSNFEWFYAYDNCLISSDYEIISIYSWADYEESSYTIFLLKDNNYYQHDGGYTVGYGEYGEIFSPRLITETEMYEAINDINEDYTCIL